MLSVPLLLGIIGMALVVWFWQSSLSARERANRAAIEACERMNLQFLDGTVAFARLGLARSEGGQLSLRRTYVFDYTATSIERRQGFVMLLGKRVESIGFEPDNQATPEATQFPKAPAESFDPNRSNVLDLEQWRQRRGKHSKPTEDGSRSPGDSGW